jgi:hypothetical protein
MALSSCSKDDNSSELSEGNSMAANLQPTGSSSKDLLSQEIFKSMLIEVVYVEGFEPTQSSIAALVSFLETRTFKPNGISIEMRSIASTGTSPYTNEDIANIEESNRTRYNTSDQIAVWAFFADGKSSSDTDTSVTLGSAYRNTSIVIFERTIQQLSDGNFEPNRDILETTVMNHEFGHILGLTNLGAPLQSQHEDTAHPKHCNVQSCLMYFAVETGAGIMQMVSGGSVPQLDAQCIADLQANGGR